jgi:hypothetical protein
MPKLEGNSKLEHRIRSRREEADFRASPESVRLVPSTAAGTADFEFRISDFLRTSDFGFGISTT